MSCFCGKKLLPASHLPQKQHFLKWMSTLSTVSRNELQKHRKNFQSNIPCATTPLDVNLSKQRDDTPFFWPASNIKTRALKWLQGNTAHAGGTTIYWQMATWKMPQESKKNCMCQDKTVASNELHKTHKGLPVKHTGTLGDDTAQRRLAQRRSILLAYKE